MIGLSFSQPARAEFCYGEKVGKVIVSGEYIYFTTNKTCTAWCQIPASWSSEAKNRAYSMLLTARSTNTLVNFSWPAASSACTALPAFALFDQIELAADF
ncbi:hypothetical protein ASD79_21135 [Caulobacter sp. Root655]|nr:hypothetical protein ASD79_21135 [Caulobacter sp. Root655]